MSGLGTRKHESIIMYNIYRERQIMREKERKKERGGEKERDGESKLVMHAHTSTKY